MLHERVAVQSASRLHGEMNTSARRPPPCSLRQMATQHCICRTGNRALGLPTCHTRGRRPTGFDPEKERPGSIQQRALSRRISSCKTLLASCCLPACWYPYLPALLFYLRYGALHLQYAIVHVQYRDCSLLRAAGTDDRSQAWRETT